MSEAGLQGAPGTSPGGSRFSLGRRLAAVVSAFAYVAIAALVVSITLTCADIVWRRVVGGAFTDTFDITKLCLLAAASWSIPYGFTHGTHITVDLLVERFSPAVRTSLDGVINLVSAAFLGLLFGLAWGSAAQSLSYGDMSPNLSIPMIYYWTVMLIGLGLAVFAALARAIDAGIEWREGPRP